MGVSKMLNNYLIGIDVTNYGNVTSSGFEDKKTLNFMTLEVKESSEEDIQVGDKVLVPINAPKEDEFDDGVVQVFHRRDVIRIL
jgi:hypothetical protein